MKQRYTNLKTRESTSAKAPYKNFSKICQIGKTWLGITVLVYKKICVEAYINNQYICLKK